MSKVIIFYAPSASGKTTLEESILLEFGDKYERLLSYATRDMRPGEINGKDNYFINIDEFNSSNFIAQVEISDKWKYGIKKEDLNIDNKSKFISIINLSYVKILYNYCISNNINVEIIYLHLSRDERISRMKLRGESEENILTRIKREDSLTTKDILHYDMLVLDMQNKSREDVFNKFKEGEKLC